MPSYATGRSHRRYSEHQVKDKVTTHPTTETSTPSPSLCPYACAAVPITVNDNILANNTTHSVRWYSIFGKRVAGSLKVKHTFIIGPSNSTPKYLPKKH